VETSAEEKQMEAKKRILESVETAIGRGSFKPNDDSLSGYRVPEWYVDGKFGIFIHWGVYSVPAFVNEWYPRNMYREGSPEFRHHLEVYGPHVKFGYKDFIPGLTASKFDPADWARLFCRAGARFIVPVAEHHDGFQMYGSELSRWNAVQMGPKRDVMGELAAAVRKEGMVFGLSSHRAEHYWFMDGGTKFDSDVRDPAYADFYGPARAAPENLNDFEINGPDAEFLDDWLARTAELIDTYRPQLIWFDWWVNQREFAHSLRKLAAFYYNRGEEWKQGVVINHKFGAYEEGTAVFDLERGQSAGASARFWQNDTSVSKNSWGYVTGQDYKQWQEIVGDLVDITAKNGALLLNIGPRADGSIPEPERAILESIGGWLETNGEAIYGTRPWLVAGEGPTRVPEGSFTDTKRESFTSSDIRFTQKPGKLYVIVMKRPEDGIVTVRSLSRNAFCALPSVGKVTLLGSEEKVTTRLDGRGLRLEAKSLRKGIGPAVFRIEPR
jgi:alpha-L-fucosidase